MNTKSKITAEKPAAPVGLPPLPSTPAMSIVVDNELIPVRPSAAHVYVLETALVARGYGVTQAALREHKRNHAAELQEGKHWISVRNPVADLRRGVARVITYWTKRGVIRLGFFIRSRRARRFRDAAEDLIVEATTARRGFLPRTMPEACRMLAAAIEKGHSAEDALKTISPETPFGTLSRKTGEPRELLVPAYFRSRRDPNGRTLQFLTFQLDFLDALQVQFGGAA